MALDKLRVPECVTIVWFGNMHLWNIFVPDVRIQYSNVVRVFFQPMCT